MEAMLDSQSTLAEEPVGIETSYPSPREGPELGAECTDTEETVLKEPALPVPVVPEHGSNSEEEDEGLPILTRRTKVLVTGNARTRKALLGKTGVVEKATGLGGWHWLVLEGTDERVKLQRNALKVLETPAGADLDTSGEDDHGPGARDAGHGPKPRAPRRPAPTPVRDSGDVKRLKTRGAYAPPRVNFSRLNTSALKKYYRYFNLTYTPDYTKDELAKDAYTHFSGLEVKEDEVIHAFALRYNAQARRLVHA